MSEWEAYEELDRLGDLLEQIKQLVDFERFRPRWPPTRGVSLWDAAGAGPHFTSDVQARSASACGRPWRRLHPFGWDRLLGARRQSANRMIKELVLARIAQPRSKRATVRELDHHGELSLNLDSVYRSMDRLNEARIQAICRRSREVTQTLLPGLLTVVFYDTTTLYFERE